MRRINKTFSSYLFSYLVLMMIPIGILGYISQTYFLDYFTQNLLENKAHTLINIKNALDMQLSQLYTNANQIAGRREFTSQYQNQRFSQFYDVCASLSSIRYANDFLCDLQLINNELGYVYTPVTRYTFDSYAEYGPCWLAYSKEDIHALFSGLTGTAWVPVQPIRSEYKMQRAVSYIFPLTREGEQVSTAILFQISEDTLMKIGGASLPSTNSQFLIADQHGRTLYSSVGDPTPMPDYFWQMLAGNDGSTPVRMPLEQEEAIVYRFFSEVSDLQYVCVIDYEEIVSPIYSLQLAFFAGMALVCILGGIAIAIFMKRNYSPIHSLSRISKEAVPGIQGDLNDLETVEFAMTAMVKNHRDTQEQNDRRTRETLLLNLLRNHTGSPEEFTAQCQSVNMFLDGPYFRVAVLAYEHTQNSTELYDRVALFMKGAFSIEIELYMLEYAEDDSIIFLFSGEKKEIAELDVTLEELSDSLRLLIPSFHIGLSSVYQPIDQSARAYQQALAAQYHRPEQPAAVLHYEPQNSNDLNSSYPSNNINALYNAILSGDTSRIEFAIDMLIPYFSNVGSAFFIVCLGYDIINTALRAMRTLDYPYFEFSKKYPELLLKTEFKSTEEIVSLVKMLCMEICTHVEQSSGPPTQAEPAGGGSEGIQEILYFIKENYTDQSFSAKVLADHFQMSISNFSHYFKKQTGRVVSAYISALRYERAKELLRTSNLPVAEIAEQSGYCHISTFMRQFKNQEGITPSTYRNQYRFASLGNTEKAAGKGITGPPAE